MNEKSILGTLATAVGVLHFGLSLHLCGTYGEEAVGGEIHALGSAAALAGAVGFTWVGARYLGPRREAGPRDRDQ